MNHSCRPSTFIKKVDNVEVEGTEKTRKSRKRRGKDVLGEAMDEEVNEEEGSDKEQDSFTYDVVAARSLRKGEEATCDYFLAEWEGEKVVNCPQPCLCSAGEGVCGGLRTGFKVGKKERERG